MQTNTDPKKIEELLTRSVDSIYPTKEALKTMLLSGMQLRVYMGIDPTATYVHLGHATNYLMFKKFHSLGHKVIVLVGDFTAMIGDPSDKSSARKRLTKEDVLENLKTFKNQIGKILNFEDTENPIEFRFNSEWLSKLNFEDIADLASNFTVQQMIERDNFQKRLKENKPLYVHEFLYPLMQGYDSVALDCDIEVGGTDQTFNMLAGRTLLKNYKNKEKVVITTTLLENPKTGEKLMSKSLGTGVGLDLDANNMFAKILALPDEAINQMFVDCTELSIEEIDKILKDLDKNKNFKEVKVLLAKEIVSIYHNKELAEKAEEAFNSVFRDGAIPEDVLEVAGEGKFLMDVCLENGLVESKSEFKRLVGEGAVIDMENKEKIESFDFVAKKTVYKIGKRRFIKMR